MEFIIGIIVVFVIWRLLTGNTRRTNAVHDAIHRAYVAKQNLTQQDPIDTPIYWEAAVKYANELKGGLRNTIGEYVDNISPYDGSFIVDTVINGQNISVLFIKNTYNGTTLVQVQ